MTEIRQGGPMEFRRALSDWFGRDVPDWVKGMHVKIHATLLDGFIDGTPVGNPELWDIWWESGGNLPAAYEGYAGGRARGGYQSSAVTPPDGEPGRIDPNGAATKQANFAALQMVKPYSHSWTTNNVPYIGALNDRPNPNVPGMAWSTQAPLQWMEAEVERVAAWFEAGLIR